MFQGLAGTGTQKRVDLEKVPHELNEALVTHR